LGALAISIYIFVYVFTYLFLYIHTYTYIHTYIFASVNIHIYIYIYIYIVPGTVGQKRMDVGRLGYLYIYIYVFIYLFISIYIYIYIYTSIHTYIHLYIYTYSTRCGVQEENGRLVPWPSRKWSPRRQSRPGCSIAPEEERKNVVDCEIPRKSNSSVF